MLSTPRVILNLIGVHSNLKFSAAKQAIKNSQIPGMSLISIRRHVSLKQVSPGWTLRISACFLSISWWTTCQHRMGNGGNDGMGMKEWRYGNGPPKPVKPVSVSWWCSRTRCMESLGSAHTKLKVKADNLLQTGSLISMYYLHKGSTFVVLYVPHIRWSRKLYVFRKALCKIESLYEDKML